MRKEKFAEGEYYHRYNRGVDKRVIFLDENDRERFVSLLYLANNTKKIFLHEMKEWSFDEVVDTPREEVVSIGVWCLMPNHFHLLIREKTENGISFFMQKVLGGYAMYFNKKYHRTGSLFEGPFKAEHANEDRYLKYLYAYIHLNPIGIIDKGWKEKIIGNKSKAKDFLLNYQDSSLFDYLKLETRSREKILSKEDFPDYFKTPKKFDEMITEWMYFEKI